MLAEGFPTGVLRRLRMTSAGTTSGVTSARTTEKTTEKTTRRTTARMIGLVGLGVAAMFSAGCDIEAQSRSADGAFDRTLRVSGPVNVNVVSRSGRIDIRAGTGDSVHVVGRIRAYGSFSAFSGSYTPEEQVKSIEAAPPIAQAGNEISVGDLRDLAFGGNVSISYEVTVPAETRLRTSSRSGDQMVELIRGPLVASSRSGRIQVARVAGDVEIETRSGEVDVRLPSVGGAALDVETRSGTIDSEVSSEVIHGRTTRHVRGIVGHGDRRVEVRTRSGSVRIR
jgi:hypothetical protein